MAEGEATVSGASDGGDGTGARMVGGFLPPRKRLLAGLKQNGLWLASSSPASPTTLASSHRTDGGGPLEAGTGSSLRSPPREGLTGEAKLGCTSCGALESDVWKKAKRNGVVQRFCELCNSALNKNLNCSRCQGVYPDVKDPEGWLECRRCRRVVHVECAQRVPTQGDGFPYICLDCVYLKKDEEHVNPLLGSGAPPIRLGSDSKTEAGSCASPATAEFSNPCKKKLKISKESRSKSNDVDGDDVGQFEEISKSTKVLLGRKGSSSKEAAAAAAATAAALAGRVAAAAKASAAAKAATAVRAAATAKAALDAAALAAKVEAHLRGELRRNSSTSERTAGGDVKVNAAQCQLRKERSEETEARTEGSGIPALTKLSSVDDEELARQLHRAINSSPRISSGLTPLRRKPSTKPPAILNVSHAMASWPRLGLSTESEPRLQMKQQQTRPRSHQLKELKLTDYRDVKLESKQFVGNSRTKVSQQHLTTLASGDAAELLVLKSEPMDSSTVTLVRQDSGNMLLQGTTIAPSTIVSNEGNNCLDGATAALCGLDGSQDRMLAATDVSQAAALLDEVLMSEAGKDEASNDEYLSRVQDRTDVHLKEDLHASETTTMEGAISLVHTRLSEEKGIDSTEGGGTGIFNKSGVAALVQVASTTIELLETQDTSTCAAFVTGPWSTAGDADRLGDGGAGVVKAPLSTPSVFSKDSSDFESPLESLPHPPAAEKEGDKVIARGIRTGQ